MEMFRKMKRNVGFIGTGLLGYPMAEKLIEAGFEVNIFNRTVSKATPLREIGGKVLDSPSEVITNSDVIITVLTNFEATKEMLFSKDCNFEDKTVIQMGTLGTEENIFLEKELELRDGVFLEAPVLGSIPQIKSKTLLTLVGSKPELFDRWKFLPEVFGKDVIYFGEVGKASAAKLAYNQLIASLTAAFSMSLGYVISQGVNTEIFMNLLRKSALYSPTFDKKLPKMLARNFDNPNFPLKHLLKDVEIIASDFEKSNIDTKILHSIADLLQEGIEKGLGELDYSAIFNTIVTSVQNNFLGNDLITN